MEWAISLHKASFYLYLPLCKWNENLYQEFLQKFLLVIINIGCGYCDMGEVELGGIVDKLQDAYFDSPTLYAWQTLLFVLFFDLVPTNLTKVVEFVVKT